MPLSAGSNDPDCPEEVKLAKRIKCMIGNKAAVCNAKEEFKLTEVGVDESGASPNPELEPSDGPDSPPDAVEVTESTVTPSSTITKNKRACTNTADDGAEGRQAKKDVFIDM